jgi:hypothetical protein
MNKRWKVWLDDFFTPVMKLSRAMTLLGEARALQEGEDASIA